jgi:hypothetical protein
VRAHEGGRICADADCDTVLSIYNPTDYCTLHTQPTGRRRMKERAVREVGCASCGTVFETHTPTQKYCSDHCRMAAFARRKREALRLEQRIIH